MSQALWNLERLRTAMEILSKRSPDDLRDLVDIGPLEEPFCGVCCALLPVVNDRLKGWQAALQILMYHDEPTYEVDPEDYMMATGLAGIATYHRCLRVYEMAEEYVR